MSVIRSSAFTAILLRRSLPGLSLKCKVYQRLLGVRNGNDNVSALQIIEAEEVLRLYPVGYHAALLDPPHSGLDSQGSYSPGVRFLCPEVPQAQRLLEPQVGVPEREHGESGVVRARALRERILLLRTVIQRRLTRRRIVI